MSTSEPIVRKEAEERFLAGIRSGKSFSEACKAPGVPSRLTIKDWLADKDSEFRVAYNDALEERDEVWGKRRVEMATSVEPDTSQVQRMKLILDTEMQNMKAFRRGTWSESIRVADADGAVIRHDELKGLTPEEIAAAIASAASKV